MTPSIERIDHVHVFVADRAAAADWYARVMGLTPVTDLKFWAGDGGPLTVGNGSGAIHLALFERPPQACRSTVALSAGAADFMAWQAHLEQTLGRPIEAVDHQVSWSLYFSDPDGNPFEVTSYDHTEIASALGNAAR